MKCPVCGNEEFVSTQQPIIDQYARLNGSVLVCTNCGYVAWFMTEVAGRYKQIQNKLKEYDEKIAELKKEIEKYNEVDFGDVRHAEKEIELLKVELKAHMKRDESSKVTRAIKESIDEYQQIIDNKANPQIINKVNRMKQELVQLENERSRISSEAL